MKRDKKKDSEFKISQRLLKEFTQFIEQHPAKRVNRNLREVFMTFSEASLDVFPLNMNDIIWDIRCLMELLDVAEDEAGDPTI